MAVKTVTVDLEAYALLVGARRGNESFSTVIKETLAPMSHTAEALLRALDRLGPDESIDESAYERALNTRT